MLSLKNLLLASFFTTILMVVWETNKKCGVCSYSKADSIFLLQLLSSPEPSLSFTSFTADGSVDELRKSDDIKRIALG